MIESNSGVLAIAVAMITVGTLMLAFVVRSIPRSSGSNTSDGDVILVAAKSGKKSKKNA